METCPTFLSSQLMISLIQEKSIAIAADALNARFQLVALTSFLIYFVIQSSKRDSIGINPALIIQNGGK
jgi:hypothetical protein